MDQPHPSRLPADWTAWDKVLWLHKGRHNYGAVRKQVREFVPDIVYLNDLELLTGSVFAACVDAGVKSVWHAHDHILHDAVVGRQEASRPSVKQRLIQRWVHDASLEDHFSTPVIAVSRFLADEYCRLGWPPDMVTVVPNGLPDRFFLAGPREAPSAEDWSILFVGRCVEDKGVFTLIEALSVLKQRGLSLRLVMVGSFPSDMARGTFMAAAERVRVRGQIDYRGVLPREQMPEVYAQAGCLLAPSLCEEAFGLMSIEAQACGTPVIGSRIGGLPETLADGESGFLCEPGDQEAVADRVQQLHDDAALWARMSAAASKFARSRFGLADKLDWVEVVVKWAAACRERGCPRRS